ncbi:MAG: ABC transporter substrate-binding protein [Gammaproteobacteria bacterium]|nr:ABC transporter substrate-binding protein [Gammaproteobacteria bacterium]NIR84886.1 ABC transporter substrate-binding protein [Gammaproteobacteria bacterium]NIR91735.1 ABC transporter substrate-binding protein [Gammaproteobacteria bacterium]NIU05933.1 ABC transporter substrate-binding protein [Gammaproteobacteria bacterium]NIV52980.1 ABC transporter substrate-binding protein [Gammaproteobacteria bacterium]
MSKRVLWFLPALALLMAPWAQAAEKIKIGFVTTLTTPAAVIGNDMRDAVELALEHIGHKMGPLEVEVIYGDDEFNPQKGRQATERLVKRDDVDIVVGYIWSHVLLASSPVVLDAGKIMISANAGPSQLAGKNCHKNFFNISWQNDQTPMALGEVLNQRGVQTLYIIAPNYAAGKNMVAGVERTFKGRVLGKDMTKWPDQIDWSAELSKVRSADPDAVFIFYPGKHGPAFITQYQQAGLDTQIPLYSVYTLDSISLPRFQDAGMNGVLGTVMTQFWAPDLDTPQNKKFISGFKKKYGHYPSFYAAQSYDSIFFIKSAVEAVNGNIDDIDGMRAALEKADFPSVRGDFRIGPNHFPIQNFYSRKVVIDDEGAWTTSIVDVVLKDHQDTYASECNM